MYTYVVYLHVNRRMLNTVYCICNIALSVSER